MDRYDLSALNERKALTRDQAIEFAYRMASCWGGEFFVLEGPDHASHRVLGKGADDVMRPALRDGWTAVGSAASLSLGQLVWQWGDGRDAPAPATPFAGLPRPLPAQLVSHLPADTRTLLDNITHLMRVQQALNGDRLNDAWALLDSPPYQVPGHAPVSYAAYLQNAERTGRVAEEIARTSRVLAAAREVFDERTRCVECMDIISGRVPVPEPAAAAVPAR